MKSYFTGKRGFWGTPWKNEVYGYAYFKGAHGLIFMNNAHFQARPINLRLDETIGLKVPAGSRLRLLAHFPRQQELQMNGLEVFKSGETIETWLRPYEVAMWEVIPEGSHATTGRFGRRELPAEKPDVESRHLELKAAAVVPEMEIDFANPTPEFRSPISRPTLEEFKQMGYVKRIIARRANLPALGLQPHVLAMILRFRKGGKPWRHTQPADLVQMMGTIGDQPIIRFITVPSFRQTHNMWCPWLVFRIRTSPAWSGKEFVASINAYLPPEVECEAEAWVVPTWWD